MRCLPVRATGFPNSAKIEFRLYRQPWQAYYYPTRDRSAATSAIPAKEWLVLF
jgi:hypothetical protein